MNKSKFMFFLSILILLVFLFLPITVFSDNSDFDVSYSFSPDEIGYGGGETNLNLTVRNTGPTNIIWVDVEIDTTPAFSRRWNVIIPPGYLNSTIFANIPFTPSDLNAQKHLRVSMNNNKVASPDGIKSFGFALDSTDSFFDINSNYAPSSSTFKPDDIVNLTHIFENNSTSSDITGLTSNIEIRKVGGGSNFGPMVSHGTLSPGAYADNDMTYTFKEEDVGTVKFFYHTTFNYMAYGYTESKKTKTVTVEANELDIDFDTRLTANPLEIDAGDVVHFTVLLDNIGDDLISEFEIKNSDGMHLASTQHLSSGDYRAITFDTNINETSDIFFEVIAKEGGVNVSKVTNSVHIIVQSTEPTATEADMEQPQSDDQNGESISENENSEMTSTDTEMFNNTSLLLYIMLGVIVLVILIAVIVVLSVLQKRKRGK